MMSADLPSGAGALLNKLIHELTGPSGAEIVDKHCDYLLQKLTLFNSQIDDTNIVEFIYCMTNNKFFHQNDQINEDLRTLYFHLKDCELLNLNIKDELIKLIEYKCSSKNYKDIIVGEISNNDLGLLLSIL